MKKFTILLLGLLLITAYTFGQNRKATVQPVPKHKRTLEHLAQNSITRSLDTVFLFPDIFADTCANTLFIFYIDTTFTDHLFGTNRFGDLEKASKLTLSGSDGSLRVLGSLVYFGSPGVQTDTTRIFTKVYSEGAEGAPDQLLATSAPVSIGSIPDTNALVPTVFLFPEPAVVDDTTFFLSVDFSETYAVIDTVSTLGDTLALFTTNDGCGTGDSWELFANGTWVKYTDSWGAQVENFMAAIVEFEQLSTSNDPFVTQRSLTLHPAYPSPALDRLHVPYQIDEGGSVRIELLSMDGKQVRTLDLGLQTPGEYVQSIDIGDLPAGTYLYGVFTDQARLMSRFVKQ